MPIAPEEDGLHIDMDGKGKYEWWYFDAQMETGQTLIVFFYAANPNPGTGGKPGVEIVLLRPDGRKTRRVAPYGRSDFEASRAGAEVKIGGNHLKAEQQAGGLLVYEVHVKEQGLGCNLSFKAQVNGWKPGTGVSKFGEKRTFAWVVPLPRAQVEGTIEDGSQVLQVRGVGYHDHNWLDFPFQSFIDYWMWGRVYSQSYTVSYAFIQCNEKMGNHPVKVLMMADGRDVVLSTGEFDFRKENFVYNPGAKHNYPKRITISVPNELEVGLDVRRVVEAQDMLESFKLPLRLAATYLLRLRPGYFRLESDFEMNVTRNGIVKREKGTALHEIVMFRAER